MAAMLHAALFVDDDAALLDTFRRTFHGEPFRILAACDTAAAPAALGREIVIVTKPCDARGLPHAIRLALQQRDAIREARRLLRHAMPCPTRHSYGTHAAPVEILGTGAGNSRARAPLIPQPD